MWYDIKKLQLLAEWNLYYKTIGTSFIRILVYKIFFVLFYLVWVYNGCISHLTPYWSLQKSLKWQEIWLKSLYLASFSKFIESIAYHEDIITWTIFSCNQICLSLDWVMGTLTTKGSLLRPLHHQRNDYHHYFALFVAFFELMNGKRVLCQDILMYKNLFDFELTLRIEWMYHTFHTLRALFKALKWIKTYQGPSVLNSLQCS